MNSINIIYGILMEGMIYGIVSLGTYIAFRILSIADMTVDGSFPLGMAISAILITTNTNILTRILALTFLFIITEIMQNTTIATTVFLEAFIFAR